MDKPAATRPACANPDAPVPYVFGGEIARGGMGCILETEDCKLGRKVAVKIMLWEMGIGEEQKQRFINEAAVLGMLEHPNIVPIHDLGRDSEGQLFYSMKLVKGRTLQAILNDIRKERGDAAKQFTLDRLLTIFRKICDAMAFAHSRSIIHRDLKPENVMVGEFGEVLVMDWGIAKNFDDPGAREAAATPGRRFGTQAVGLTMEGVIMGSPNYMSPEQAGGRMIEMDARSDIFSLGGILYAILTLHPPVEGTTLDEVLKKVTSGSITPPASFGTTTSKPKMKGAILEAAKIKPLPHCPGGRVPAALSAVTMKALALKREHRYQNVAAFATDIEAFQNGFATSAENAGAWKQFTLLIKRHKVAAAAIAASLLLLVGISSAFTARLVNERNIAVIERQRAEDERSNAITERKNAEDQRHKAEEQSRRAENESKRAQQALAEAKAERTRATSESMRAEQAVGDLKTAAPPIYAIAKTRYAEARVTEAIEQIDAALQFDPNNPDYHLFRAHALEIDGKFDEAIKEYQSVLSLRPGDQETQTNIALCQQLRRRNYLISDRQVSLLAFYRQNQRDLEVSILERLLNVTEADLLKKLDYYRKTPAWPLKKDRITRNPDGTFRVDLDYLPIPNLEFLDDFFISELSLNSNTNLDGLTALSKLPLKVFSLTGTTQVRDIQPLASLPLESLTLENTSITDLRPLKNMPLKFLSIAGSKVINPTPLEHLKLTELNGERTKINTITPLRGHPLEKLYLGETQVTDLAPLAGNTTLIEIGLPELRGNIEVLRHHPTLKSFKVFKGNGQGYVQVTAEQFWLSYDREQAAKKNR